MQKLKLVSDFRDYYDSWFDLEGEIFHRLTTGGMNRLEQLQFMEKNGLKVPKHGKVSSLDCEKVVVYIDQTAHCGEGKLLLETKQALELYPDSLATEYINKCPGLSWRYLQIGLFGY